MELIKAILMGLLQGITEYMPVSSTGHMVIVNNIFKSDNDMMLLFEIMLHLSSLIAVMVVFAKDIAGLFVAFFGILLDIFSNAGIFIIRLLGGKTKGYYILNSSPYRKFLINLTETAAVACIVALGMKPVAMGCSYNMTVTGAGFILTAVMLLVADRLPAGFKKIKNLNGFDAVIIGAIQGFAVFPGVSRMGIALVMAMLLGVEKNFAIKYSAISSIPVIIGAFIIELTEYTGSTISMGIMSDYLAAALLCCAVSVLSIKVVMGIMRNYRFRGFAVYGLIAGIFSIVISFIR